ncbi:MAG: addiction module toxin RelE, partial [Gammaproteobacteria bacterium]
AWLQTKEVLALFGRKRAVARERFIEFVREGLDAPSPWTQLKGQIYLGDDDFVKRMQGKARQGRDVDDIHIPKTQRRAPAPSLETIASTCVERDQAIIDAYATGAYSYQQIGDFFGIHFTTVGKIVRKA